MYLTDSICVNIENDNTGNMVYILNKKGKITVGINEDNGRVHI